MTDVHYESNVIDFEVEREVWNRYEIPTDNVELRVRAVTTKFQRKPDPKDVSKFEYSGESTTISSVVPKKGFNLFGKPYDGFISQEQLNSARKVSVDFNTIMEDWNIYRLSDGKRVKMKLIVVNVFRLSDLYDPHGMPVYHFESTLAVSVNTN